MNCLSDGGLRAYLDNELPASERLEADLHLQNCAACRERSGLLSAVVVRVGGELDWLQSSGQDEDINTQFALSRFKSRIEDQQKPASFLGRIFAPRWRFAWATSMAAAIIIASLISPTARGMAQRLLATLRIQRVQTVRLDLSSLNGNRTLQEMLGKMISDNVVVTADEKTQQAADAEAASKLAGFEVRLLRGRADSATFDVEGEHAFHMAIDRERLQDALDQAGRGDLLLPATLEGATVSVQVPRAVETRYGDCARQRSKEDKPPQPEKAGKDCIFLVQAPSPVINVPSDLNLQQLAETALQVSGMSSVQARQFCQAIDWKSTLILPIPRFVNSYNTVEVDGAQGTLMQTSDRHGSAYVLIWVKNGIIYFLGGSGAADKAVELANSLD